MRIPFAIKSIHVKMIFCTGIIFTLCMIISSFLQIQMQQSQRLASSRRKLEAIETTVERSLAYAMGKGRSKEVQATIQMIGTQKDIEHVRIFSESGIILRSSRKEEVGTAIDPIYVNSYEQKKFNFIQEKNGKSYPINTMIKPIPNEPRCYPCHNPREKITGVLEVCISLSHVEQDINLIYKSTIISSILTLLSVAVIGIFLQFKVVHQPLKKLTTKIREVEGGDLTARVDLKSNDELGRLGKSFNDMVEKLDQAQKEVKKYHQEQLARADRLASIGEITAGIAHEIRNPLAGISGAIQVIVSDFDFEDPRKEIAEELLFQVERLNKTVSDTLAFSRPTPPELKHVNIHEVIDRALFFITSDPKQTKAIAIVKEFDESLPLLNIDERQIQQVLLNIFLNAVRAIPDSGELRIKTLFAQRAEGEVLIVEITDTGIGMDQDTLGKIFNPFFSTRSKGTGLGLSVAKTIIEQHQGVIYAESVPDKGSKFIITFKV